MNGFLNPILALACLVFSFTINYQTPTWVVMLLLAIASVNMGYAITKIAENHQKVNK